MSSLQNSFIGNLSEQDALTALSLVGSSRVVEIAYISPSFSTFLGNFLAVDKLLLSLGTGSRVVEVAYISATGD